MTQCALSHDGSLVISGSLDNNLLLYEACISLADPELGNDLAVVTDTFNSETNRCRAASEQFVCATRGQLANPLQLDSPEKTGSSNGWLGLFLYEYCS